MESMNISLPEPPMAFVDSQIDEKCKARGQLEALLQAGLRCEERPLTARGCA